MRGGGSSTTSNSTAPAAAAPAPTATLSLLGIGGQSPAFAQAVSLLPTFTGTMTLSIGTGSTNPTVRVDVNVTSCAGAQNFAAVVTLRSDNGSFSATPSQTFANNQTCQYTLTRSVNGVAGTPVSGSFTTEAVVSKPVFDYMLTVYGNRARLGVVEADTSSPSGYKVTEFTSAKTGYDNVALCGVYMKGDSAWIPADGYPRSSCQTPAAGNLRRLFVSKVKGELTAEYTTTVIPADVTLRDVSWTQGVSPYPTQVTGHGDFLQVGSDILYLPTVGMHIAVTRDGFVSSLDLGVEGAKFLTTVKSQN